MKRNSITIVAAISVLVFALSRCKKEDCPPPDSWSPTYYTLKVPAGFPEPNIPADNPMTYEGIELGHRLFFDKRFSSDNTLSCASCHHQSFFFADLPDRKVSTGVNGAQGKRNAMVIFNLAWQEHFFWDGRAMSLEEQALMPIEDPTELNNTLPVVVARLEADSLYPSLFKAAFGDEAITPERIGKAIAQFERTIISSNSKFDRVERLKIEQYTPEEQLGRDMFFTDFTPSGIRGGDCFHCHGSVETSYLMGAFGRDNQFKNNGLNATHVNDKGRADVTNLASDEGKFKVGTVRNMEWSFPYMHNGSIATIADLIEFYNSGVHEFSPNIDPNMSVNGFVDKNWTQVEKGHLEAFLMTLTDDSLRFDPAFQDPFEK